MQTKEKSLGIVLLKREVKDYDAFYVIFARDFGRMSLFAKSVRKPQSKMSFHLEPGSLVEFAFVPRLSEENYLLTGADLVWRPDFLQGESGKNKVILRGLKLVDKLMQESLLEEEEIKLVFNYLENYLKEIEALKIVEENKKRAKLALLEAGLVLYLMAANGMELELDYCFNCGEKLDGEKHEGEKIKEGFFYDAQEGSFKGCFSKEEEALFRKNKLSGLMISPSALKVLRFIRNQGSGEIKKLTIAGSIAKEVWQVAFLHLKAMVYNIFKEEKL